MSGHASTKSNGLYFSIGSQDFLNLVWEPEGLVLTPRSESAEYGYGFPKRELGVLVEEEENGVVRRYFTGGAKINPPFGTKIESEEDQCLNQVILNRFENNKYLDRKEFIVGLPTKEELRTNDKTSSDIIDFPVENRRLRDELETEVEGKEIRQQSFFQYAPVFYNPPTPEGDVSFWAVPTTSEEFNRSWVDEPGLNHWGSQGAYTPFIDKDVYAESKEYVYKYRQFEVNDGIADRQTSLIYEEESTEWFCHWPEELLYDNDGYEMVFYMTNFYRNEVGRPPLFREIRGLTNTAKLILAECQRAEVLYHENENLFRQGYQLVEDRTYTAGTNGSIVGENVQIGFGFSLNLADGEKAAIGWRNSPPHYANMISSNWDNVKNSTSLEVFGKIYGKATESQFEGVLDPVATGNFWSEFFTARDFWLGTGWSNQVTQYGHLSFFSSIFPLAMPYGNASFFLCYKGRVIFNSVAYNFYLEDYAVGVLGAALYKNENQIYIRLITITSKETIKLYAHHRPLFANYSDEWTEEASLVLEPTTGIISQASFNFTGEVAIISSIVGNNSDVAESYFPPALNQFNTVTDDFQEFTFANNAFTISRRVKGPKLTYTVETDTYIDDEENAFKYITKYEQTCSSEEPIQLYPFYVPNEENTQSELKYLTMDCQYNILQTRTGFEDPVYDNEYAIEQKVVLYSGKELVVIKAVAKTNPTKTALLLEGEAFFIIFFYIDPCHDDIIYMKVNLRGEGTEIYGQASLYVRLKEQEEPVEIKSYSEVLINSSDLANFNLVSVWEDVSGKPDEETVATGIIVSAISFVVDDLHDWHPLMTQSEIQPLWKCTNYTGEKRSYSRKPLTGEHYATLTINFGSFNICRHDEDNSNFVFAANIKIASWESDGIRCQAARYKDRFVTQIDFDLDRTHKLWKTPFIEERLIWANFPLDEEVGIGKLTNIFPFGVVL